MGFALRENYTCAKIPDALLRPLTDAESPRHTYRPIPYSSERLNKIKKTFREERHLVDIDMTTCPRSDLECRCRDSVISVQSVVAEILNSSTNG